MSEAIGIMEGAFFVSRGELIQWINSTFHLNITKIEQLGSGSVYCQIFDAIHPGKINMSKVNWKARLEWEFVNNLKILQQAFLKCKLSKYIEIERLAKAKYQDNLEFAQWMKRYYDLNHGGGKDYDPEARRFGVEPDFGFGGEKPISHMQQQQSNPPEQPKVNRKNNHKAEEKLAVPTTHGRNKDLRSFSPSQRDQPKSKSMRKRSDFSDESKHDEHDILSLYQNLMAMKNIVLDQKTDGNEKLKKMNGLINLSLKSKIFENERRKQANNKPIEKIVEDEEKEVSAYT